MITSLIFFIVTIAAIVVTMALLRFVNKRGLNINGKKNPQRLAILDTIAVDRVRRLILVRRDDVEHLILIGGTTDIVVESDTKKTKIPHKERHMP
ncbi:hypothetical protein [Bartonella ancashensis]|uniref:hypothetical protein n=1 Tax=Bartonella ancashensis TaxID=1318743 RepID=UPI0039E4AB88